MKRYILTAILLAVSLGFISNVSFAQVYGNVYGDVDPGTDNPTVCTNLAYNLKLGSRDRYTNGEVTLLQEFLVERSLLEADPSGYFGHATLSAAKKFQAQQNLLNSGYVGPLTRAAIKSLSCSGSADTNTTSTNTKSSASAGPSVTLTANDSSVTDGGTVAATNGTLNLVWGSAGATSCTFNGSAVASSGTHTFAGLASPSTNLYTCKNSHGSKSIKFFVTVSSAGSAPTISLSAYGSPVPDGSTVNATNRTLAFAWDSTNATSCTLNGIAVPTSGSKTFYNLNSTPYTFTCTNSYGSKSVQFNVSVPTATTSSAPTLTLSADGSSVTNGATVTAVGGALSLAWGSANATSCIFNSNAIATSGTQMFTGLTSGTHTYACTNSAGTNMLTFSVNVPVTTGSVPTLTLTANGSSVTNGGTIPFTSGGTLVLEWGSTQATSCTLNGSSIPTSGTRTFTGLTSASYTFSCANSYGSKSRQFSVNTSTVTSNSATSSIWGTYQLYINGIYYPASANVSRATALSDCTGQKTNNPTASIRCTWNGEEIMNYAPASTGSVPTVWMKANGSPVTNGSTVTATDGNLSLEWGSTSAIALTCTLNGVSIPSSGVRTFSGLTTSNPFTYTCTNSSGSASLQLNLSVLTTTVSAAPYPVTFKLDKASVDKDANFTASWSGTGATEFTFRVRNYKDVTLGASVTSWTGTPASLGVTAGEYTMSVMACNSKGCTWSPEQTLRVTSPNEASAAPYPVTFKLDKASVDKDANFTASWSAGVASLGTLPTGFTFKVVDDRGTLKLVPMSSDVTSWTGTPSSLGMAAGQNYTMSIQACNSKGCTWSAPITLTVTAPTTSSTFGTYQLYMNGTLYGSNASVSQATALADCMGQRTNSPTATIRCTWNGTEIYSYTPDTSATANTSTASVPTLTLSANGSSVANGGTITATNGATTLVWGSTNATSCTLNGSAIPSSGSQSFTGLVNSTHAYTCSNSAGTATLTFTIVVPSVLGVFAQCIDLPYNMHRGYESYAVTKLQEFLKSRNFLGEVTGFYGDKTVAAVKEYQATKDLPVTGMVYDFTRSAIKGDSCQ